MKLLGIVWTGVETAQFDAMATFMERLIGTEAPRLLADLGAEIIGDRAATVRRRCKGSATRHGGMWLSYAQGSSDLYRGRTRTRATG